MMVELRNFIFAAIHGDQNEPPETTLADVLVPLVVQMVEEVLADFPAVPAQWLRNPRIFASEVLRKLGLNPIGRTVELELARKIRRVILQHYWTRPDIVQSQRRREVVRGWEPSQGVLDELKEKFSFQDLQFLGALGGGRSDSIVFGCYAQSNAAGDSIVIIKLTEDKETFDREKSGQSFAGGSWMSNWVLPNIKGDQLRMPPRTFFVLVSPLAIPPTVTKIYPESLASLVSKGQAHRAQRVIEQLSRGYARAVIQTSQRIIDSRRSFVDSLRRHWPGLDVAGWCADFFWEQADLPGPTHRWIQDGGTILSNPLWFMNHSSIAEDKGRRVFLRLFQHGDLNCDNILVNVEQRQGPAPLVRIIDFEKAGDQSAVLDVCWLSLWLLYASYRSPEAGAKVWDAIAPQVVKAVLNDEAIDQHLGAFQLGIDLIRTLVSQTWQDLDRLEDENQQALLRNRLTEQFALTLTMCSAAMAGYEVRKFNRAVDEGASYSDNVCRVACLWACCYLRISAYALAACRTDDTIGEPAGNLRDSIRRLV